MEQVDVIPQHCFSAHPQPKSSSMKKAVSFLLVLLSLMLFVLSAAFADTETKVYRMDNLEVFCSFYYDANDDLWILTSDRLMQYTSDGVLNEVMENTEKLELVVHDGEKFIGVNQSNQILIYSDGLWTKKHKLPLGMNSFAWDLVFPSTAKSLCTPSTVPSKIGMIKLRLRLYGMQKPMRSRSTTAFSTTACAHGMMNGKPMLG